MEDTKKSLFNLQDPKTQRHENMTNQRECGVEIQLGYTGEKVEGEAVCSFL